MNESARANLAGRPCRAGLTCDRDGCDAPGVVFVDELGEWCGETVQYETVLCAQHAQEGVICSTVREIDA